MKLINEDLMFMECMGGKRKVLHRGRGITVNDSTIGEWNPPGQPGVRLRYQVASLCLANKWSQEHTLVSALFREQPPPFGLHALCRPLIAYGDCKKVEGGIPARPRPFKPGDPPNPSTWRCNRRGFSMDRAFDQWSKFCGANLDYMRSCVDVMDEGNLTALNESGANDARNVRRSWPIASPPTQRHCNASDGLGP